MADVVVRTPMQYLDRALTTPELSGFMRE